MGKASQRNGAFSHLGYHPSTEAARRDTKPDYRRLPGTLAITHLRAAEVGCAVPTLRLHVGMHLHGDARTPSPSLQAEVFRKTTTCAANASKDNNQGLQQDGGGFIERYKMLLPQARIQVCSTHFGYCLLAVVPELPKPLLQ
jgi:hypothetical protein